MTSRSCLARIKNYFIHKSHRNLRWDFIVDIIIDKLGFISLPPGGRGTTKWWKEPALQKVIIIFIITHSPSVAYGASSLPEGAFELA